MADMTLSEELTWRGFVNQTTFKDIKQIDSNPMTFYWGVDPSASSMTIGNLAAAMMVRHFMNHGHKAFLLVGGATGMIGDPDGKAEERELKSLDEIAANKTDIIKQYEQLFAGKQFEVVDNYKWFSSINYLDFLRDTGKHVPMRQMLGRDFVQKRLSEAGAGISYAEFSYVLIQAYDFLRLFKDEQVTLQLCGSDQWGNSIAGVDLIRRVAGGEAHVWSTPLVVNQATGVKFGKTEDGAVWLDPKLTTPTQFYQFWINVDDEGVENYLKIYTLLAKSDIEEIMNSHHKSPGDRIAQWQLAQNVTEIVHGKDAVTKAMYVTDVLTGKMPVADARPEVLHDLREEIPSAKAQQNADLTDVLVEAGLASSKTEARRLLEGNAILINGQKTTKTHLEINDFAANGCLLLRRGKAFKDSALIEIKK